MDDRDLRLRCLELAVAAGAGASVVEKFARRYESYVRGESVLPRPYSGMGGEDD